MTRRSAYLLTWGVAFLALGVFLIEVQVENSYVWALNFGTAGLVSILGAVTRYRWIDTAGFVILAMTSAARAVWFIWDFFKTDLTSDILGFFVWAAVAAAQVIVAGWPEHRVDVQLLPDRDLSGTE